MCPFETTVKRVSELIDQCHREALPFLVAVKKQPHHTERPQSTIGRRRALPEDEVYGLALAHSEQPFDNLKKIPENNMVNNAASLEAVLVMYVRHDVWNQRIGSALLDVALSALIPSPFYHPYGGTNFNVSADAVLGWKKPITEIQIWLILDESLPGFSPPHVLGWLTSPRWGFEAVNLASQMQEMASNIRCLHRKIGQ